MTNSSYASGEAPPTASPPNFTLVNTSDFSTGQIDSTWNEFNTTSDISGSQGIWNSSKCVLSGGVLQVQTVNNGGWVSCGMGQQGLTQTYGKYLVRWRADVASGVALDALLWPANNTWPPEVDFYEDDGGMRQAVYAFQHYSSSNQQNVNGPETPPLGGDFTSWHTLGVEWTPNSLVYTIDGTVWGQQQNSNVPNIPMWMGWQEEVFNPQSSTPAFSAYDINWAVVYSYTPGSGCSGG